MPTGLIVSKLVTTVILLLSNVITMFLPNFVQLDDPVWIVSIKYLNWSRVMSIPLINNFYHIVYSII